jgi:hypothetical protein
MRMCRKRVLRNVLGPNRRMGSWVGGGVERGAYRVLVGEIEEEIPLGRPRHI